MGDINLTADTFTEIQEDFKNRPRCRHVGSKFTTHNGLELPCCTGSSTQCKQEAFDYLATVIQTLCKRIDQLEGSPSISEQKHTIMEELRKPKVVNNNYYQVNTYNNYIHVDNTSITDIVKSLNFDPNNRSAIYTKILELTAAAPQNEATRKILTLAKSTNLNDVVDAELEIHNILVDAFRDSPEPQVDAFLESDAKTVVRKCEQSGIVFE